MMDTIDQKQITLMTLVHHLTELETYTPMTFNYLMKQEKILVVMM